AVAGNGATTPGTVEETVAGEGAVAGTEDDATALAGRVPVPALTAVAIGICVAVTVVFGVIPGPLVDLAHKATLLFLP
ncbi:MAG: hypothetical protein ACRDZR_04040, partial [Acidimicrobiales bacterium]